MSLMADICYLIFLIAAWPYFLYRVIVTGKYRQGWGERLGGIPRRESQGPCLWVHGVSVGEVLAARKLVALFQARHPGWQVVISTTTPTGQQVARRSYPHKVVFYFPLDFSWAVRRAFQRLCPSLIALVEVELWPNFLRAATKRRIPVVLVNGSLSQRSYRRYRWLRPLARRMLSKLALYCVQTEEYAQRFLNLGVEEKRIAVTGSMKYDNISMLKGKDTELAAKLGLGEAPVLMAGSTHHGEEELLLECYSQLKPEFPDLRLVIVPRHPERFLAVARLIQDRGFTCLRKSELDGGKPAASAGDSPVLLVDTLGELAKLYEVADMVFVGGTLVPVGGHNLLEPAACGRAVLFGPHVFKQQQSADELLHQEAAIQVAAVTELTKVCRRLLANPQLLRNLGERAQELIARQQGASSRTLDMLTDLIAAQGLDKPRKTRTPERSTP